VFIGATVAQARDMASDGRRRHRAPPGATRVLRQEEAFEELAARFGAELRRRRGLLGWTQQHAAEMLGLSWRHVQDIEAGKVNITLLLLYRFSIVYGFEVPGLFGGSGPAQ
jgi:DNA-binding XRE family transcriptional regulator